MRFVECSDFLRRQEQDLLRKAHHVQTMRLAPPGIWRALVWRVSGARSRARAARDQQVRELIRAAGFYRQGIEGEDVLRESLARQLDNRFTLFTGYTPPSPWHVGGDIDAVLVGPHGVTVFEAKAWNGYYMCAGDEWWYRSQPWYDWLPAQGNPTAQARANAERVAATLRAHGIANVRVQPMVAIASQSMDVMFDRQAPPKVYLYFACRPTARFDQRDRQPTLPGLQIERILQALVPPTA